MNKYEQLNRLFIERLTRNTNNKHREVFSFLDEEFKKHNLILIGLRQVGKTTLTEQLGISFCKQNNMKNFDEVFYVNLKAVNKLESEELLAFITQMQYKLVIIDEIQIIDKWSNFGQALIDLCPNTKFIFTGSNASALSSETLFNRAKIYFIDPLSFNEFKLFWGENRTTDDYLQYGSFPPTKQYDSLEAQYIQMIDEIIIDKIVNDDFNGIKKQKFEALANKINNHIGNDFKLQKIEDDQITRQTARAYLSIMELARFTKTIYRYEDKSDKMIGKVYFIDKSLIYKLNDYLPLNNNLMGSMIENTVFCHLNTYFNRKFGTEDIYVYKNNNKEIDFVIKSIKTLIEVKYINASKAEWLEVTNQLNKVIGSNVHNFKKIIVTKDFDEVINGWTCIPFKTFLEMEISLLQQEK